MAGRFDPARTRDPRAGFNLIQVSIALTVASFIMVSILPGREAGDALRKSATTNERMMKIEKATTGFMAAYGRRPCPADGQYDVDSANFGIEGANPGACTGGTPAAPLGPDAGTGNVVAGVVPTKTLGLPDEYAFDEWGRRITYVVDKRATAKRSCRTLQNYPVNNGSGGIAVKDGTAGNTLASVMAAYISHGPDGHGAFPMQGGSVASRINVGSLDADTLTNAGVNSSFTYDTTNFTSTKVLKEKTGTFDDLAYFAEYQKNICCIGSVCTSPGFRLDGATANQQLGQWVGSADLNGDGLADLIVSDANGNLYVVFGQPNRNGFPDSLPVSALNGSNGFKIPATDFMKAVTGDFNGDGITDLAFWTWSYCNIAQAYIIYGQTGGWPASVNLATLSKTSNPRGMTIGGMDGCSPFSIAAGNVTGATNGGHGIDSLILGGVFENGNKGNTYVIFGSANPASSVSLGSLNGTNGTKIAGAVADGFTGTDVAAGDFNADGIKDIAIGARGGNMSFIIWGKAGAWPATINLGSLAADGSQGVKLYTSQVSNNPLGNGMGVADLNGDGRDDLVLGSRYCPFGTWACSGKTVEAAYAVLFGTPSWAASNKFDLSSLNGTNGTAIAGVWEGPWDAGFGGTPKFADIGGDATKDFMSQASYGSPMKYYAVFGKANWPSYLTTDTLDGTNGFRFTGSTSSVLSSGAGDINGDGTDDYLIGDPEANANNGVAYIIKGARSGYPATITSATISSYGLQINGASGDNAGTAVGSADLDNDGIGDIVIGAPGHSPGGVSSAGSVYVLYGSGSIAGPIDLGTVLP